MPKLIITIDGPAGSGKSSVAKALAKKINADFLDTGAMYRAATVAAIESNCELSDEKAVLDLLEKTDFDFLTSGGEMKVLINGLDVSEKIRLPEITSQVHHIASKELLRNKLVQMQQAFAARHEKIVTEGRDQGTVAFPEAKHKFFITAEPGERAKRRAKELKEKGIEVNLQKLKAEIEKRDRLDAERKIGPLTPAAKAIIIDTTKLTFEEVVETLLDCLKPELST